MQLCKKNLQTWIQRNRISIEKKKKEMTKKKQGFYNLSKENQIQTFTS